jgi:hypothetical protein
MGPGEVEALAVVAAEQEQLVVLFGGLDAFGDDGHVEAVGELDDGGHHGVVDGIASEVGDEGPVYLDDVDWEFFR